MKKVEMWEAKNGMLFKNRHSCAEADGLVVCKNCYTTGLEEYEHATPYPDGLPDSGWVDDTIEIRERTCTRCNGFGYVEINPEDDEEYQLFLKLKEKYKDSK